jgi:hypothetical protein
MLVWACTENGRKQNSVKSVIYECGNNGRPRNRWQDEVREDGRTVGGEGWQEKVHNRKEWRKLLRTANLFNICDASSIIVCAWCDFL